MTEVVSSKVVEKMGAGLAPAPTKVAPVKPQVLQVHILSKGGALCDEFSKIRVYPYREGHTYTGFENVIEGYKPAAGHEFCAQCKERFEQYRKK